MLGSTNTSNESMRQLRNVRQVRILDISNTKVSDNAVESIASLEGLKGVNLSGTSVTLAGAAKLKNLRPEIWLVHDSLDIAWDGGAIPDVAAH